MREKKHTTDKHLKAECIRIRGNRYNYDKVEYVDSKTKMIVICKIHGEFPTIPSNHLKDNGSNCPKCNNITTAEKLRQL